jgi:hypothetical protein
VAFEPRTLAGAGKANSQHHNPFGGALGLRCGFNRSCWWICRRGSVCRVGGRVRS